MRTLPGAGDGPVLDPRLDELNFPVTVRRWASARGATTLRELARIPPAELTDHPDSSAVLADVRAVLERYFGRTWEELASVEAVGPAGGRRPRLAEPRLPASWDELRLVLPAALRAVPLLDLDLPTRMELYAERGSLQTLGELARESAHLLGLQRMGRITVHRTFLAVMAYARRAGTPVVMLPAVSLAGALDGGAPIVAGGLGAELGAAPSGAPIVNSPARRGR